MLHSALDVLYPPTCICFAATTSLCGACRIEVAPLSGPLCSACGVPFAGPGSNHLCGNCIARPPLFRQARACAAYVAAGPRQSLRDAIHLHKYGRRLWIAEPLGHLMDARSPFADDYDLVVPVPLHRDRLRWRGFNQSLLLARRLARRRFLKLLPMALERRTPTRPQVELTATERLSNVHGAFVVRQAQEVRGRRILLVDDVMTTGATVNECAKVLRHAGAQYVDVLVLARAVAG